MNQRLARHQLLIFCLLSYALSWWPAPFTGGQLLPHGPAIAALLTIALTSGRPGLAEWWKRLIHRPAGWWVFAGPLLIAALQGIAFLVAPLLGIQAAGALVSPSASVILELLLLGGLWEEPGWTGYALPELQRRYADRPNGGLLAALHAGLIRAGWHLPLFIYGHIPWFDLLIFEAAFQLIIAWVYNRNRGSVPAVMLLHFTSNLLGAGFFMATFAESQRTSYFAIYVALAVLLALILAGSGALGSRQSGASSEQQAA